MEYAIKTLNYKLNHLIEHRDKCRRILRRKDQKGFEDWMIKTRDEATRNIADVRKALKTLKGIQDGADYKK